MAAVTRELFGAQGGAVSVLATYDDGTFVVSSFTLLTGPQSVFVSASDGTRTFTQTIPANTNQVVAAPANLSISVLGHALAAWTAQLRAPAT